MLVLFDRNIEETNITYKHLQCCAHKEIVQLCWNLSGFDVFMVSKPTDWQKAGPDVTSYLQLFILPFQVQELTKP